MKKIFAGIVLPTLAAAAVIGSGFSIWFFGENQDSVSTNASIEVQNLLRIGNLGTDSSAILHLDQTKGVRSAILTSNKYVSDVQDKNFDKKSNFKADGFGKDTYVKGLYLTSDTGFDGVIKYEAPESFDAHLQTAKIEIVTTFTFTGELKNYVGMVQTNNEFGNWTTSTAGSGVYTFKWKHNNIAAEKAMQLPMTSDVTASDFKFEYVAYTNQYESLKAPTAEGYDLNRDDTTIDAALKTAEPHTDAEYSKMLGDVKTGSSLTIETVATIIEA